MRIHNILGVPAFSCALVFSGLASAQTPASDTDVGSKGCGAGLCAVQADAVTLKGAALHPAVIKARIGVTTLGAASSARSLPSARTGQPVGLDAVAAASGATLSENASDPSGRTLNDTHALRQAAA